MAGEALDLADHLATGDPGGGTFDGDFRDRGRIVAWDARNGYIRAITGDQQNKATESVTDDFKNFFHESEWMNKKVVWIGFFQFEQHKIDALPISSQFSTP